MEQSKKLNEEQIKFINDNYKEIFKKLKKRIKNSSTLKYGNINRHSYLGPEDFISFLPEVVMEYIPGMLSEKYSGADENKYRIDFCVDRCILRMLDLKRNSFFGRCRNFYAKKYNAEAESIAIFGFVNDEYVDNKLISQGFDRAHIALLNRSIFSGNDEYFDSYASKEESLDYDENFEFKDAKDTIIKYIEGLGLSDKTKSEQFKEILNCYLFPKAENREYERVKDLAKRLNLHQNMVHKMIHSHTMKRIVRKSFNG